jgi:protein-S-isoprenylcysteine O-methyltransferase Ste14
MHPTPKLSPTGNPPSVAAGILSISVPFLLGSLWALIPGITAAVLMIIRTSLEDRTLQVELAGYQEYVRQVRYRLIPGIW